MHEPAQLRQIIQDAPTDELTDLLGMTLDELKVRLDIDQLHELLPAPLVECISCGEKHDPATTSMYCADCHEKATADAEY